MLHMFMYECFPILSGERVQSISNDFLIGFGSFVEKAVGSFIAIDPIRYSDITI